MHVQIKQKRIPVHYLNTIIDDIFNDSIFGYDPSALISTFFNSNSITVDDKTYPIMNQHLLNNGSVLYEFALSNFSKDEIEIDVVNNELIVKGKQKEGKSRKDISKTLVKKIAERDFVFKSFISEKMDVNKIECSLSEGILSIIIPLKEEMKPVSKKLEIK